ncbi:hypothetical protein Tco_0431966, partial [Tanacetum coccineum]
AKQSHVVVSKEVIPEIKSADIMFHEWKMSKAGIINKGFMKMIDLKKSSKHGKVTFWIVLNPNNMSFHMCAKTNNSFSFLKPGSNELINHDLNEKQQQSVFCKLLLIIFEEQVEKTIETTYTTNLRSMMQVSRIGGGCALWGGVAGDTLGVGVGSADGGGCTVGVECE